MMKLRYLVLFVSIFSLFFFPTLLYAQSSTPWSFYNNPSQSNAMDIFYNGIGAANPAVRITTGGNVGIGATSPGQKLQVRPTIMLVAQGNGTLVPVKLPLEIMDLISKTPA